MRPALLVAGLGLAALAGGSAGFFGYRIWHHQPLPVIEPLALSRAAPDEPSSDSAPEPPAHPPVPESLPDLRLPDQHGQMKSLHDYLGRALIINFWATWCAPCRREIPLLQQLRQASRGQLEVVGIAVDFKSAVDDFLAHRPISYPLLIGQEQGLAAAEKFGMQPVLPFSVFVDAKGQIIAVKVGELHREEADYILTVMRSVATGSMSVASAREGIAQRLRALAIERARAGNTSS
jgi:thiol-disulfide isomerase/thioredoxin